MAKRKKKPKIPTEVSCPYCGTTLDKLPRDGSPCPECGETIHVYASMLGNERILITDDGQQRMVRTRSAKESKDYLVARMQELEACFAKASATTGHYPELGRELESCVKALLEEFLPNKYCVATGFVRSLERPDWASNQIDILLSRNDICYPIAVHREFKVFPIEAIVSFMEVTSNLTKAKLREDYEKVADLQRLHKRQYYVPDPPAGLKPYVASQAPHPRFYYFAYESQMSSEATAKALMELSNAYGIQLHALLVLRPIQCFVMPNAVRDQPTPYEKIFWIDNPSEAIVIYLEHILTSLQSADFIPANASIPFRQYSRLLRR